MDQMHAYRDAIMDARGEKVVIAGLVPLRGRAGRGSRPLIAYGPPAASIVGALRLRPGDADGFERLCQLLSAWDVVCGIRPDRTRLYRALSCTVLSTV